MRFFCAFSLYLLKLKNNFMYEFIQKLHSGWAYVALIVSFLALLNAVYGWSAQNDFTERDRKISLFGLIAVHTQMLIGFVLYFVSPKGLASLGEMKNATLRTTSLEHPLISLIAITLITIGWIKHKKATKSSAKFKLIAILYGLGFALIISKIPMGWFKLS
jgi:hypothetical protein